MTTIGVELSCQALGDEVRVLACHGSEAMNALPRWDLRVLLPEAVDPEPAVGSSAALRIVDGAEGGGRLLDLIVISVAHEEDGRDGSIFSLELGPPAWLLTRRSQHRIFQEKTTKE